MILVERREYRSPAGRSYVPHVYFAVGGGKTKVGYARDPEERIRDIQKCSPVEITIVATTEGGRGLESRIHSLMLDRHPRSHGEWFHGEISPAEALDLIEHAGRAAQTTETQRSQAIHRGLRNARSREEAIRTGRMFWVQGGISFPVLEEEDGL